MATGHSTPQLREDIGFTNIASRSQLSDVALTILVDTVHVQNTSRVIVPAHELEHPE